MCTSSLRISRTASERLDEIIWLVLIKRVLSYTKYKYGCTEGFSFHLVTLSYFTFNCTFYSSLLTDKFCPLFGLHSLKILLLLYSNILWLCPVHSHNSFLLLCFTNSYWICSTMIIPFFYHPRFKKRKVCFRSEQHGGFLPLKSSNLQVLRSPTHLLRMVAWCKQLEQVSACVWSHSPRSSVLTGGISTKLNHWRFPAHLTVKALLYTPYKCVRCLGRTWLLNYTRIKPLAGRNQFNQRYEFIQWEAFCSGLFFTVLHVKWPKKVTERIL